MTGGRVASDRGRGGGADALRRLRRTRPATDPVPTLPDPALFTEPPLPGPAFPGPLQPGERPAGRLRPGGSGQPEHERCEMCGVPIAEQHSHVVHLENRSLLCTCRPCALLFTERGAARGRYRAVPDRYLRDPALRVTDMQWNELQIPVRMAFFFHNSELDKTLAFYPSPAGATESLLPMDAWRDGLGASSLGSQLEPDVEALLVRHGTRDRPQDTACLLVPIDVCYELVGLVRVYWKGFDGGSEAWERIDAFFAGLAELARDIAPRTEGG
ncbi:MAG TPA: DUF5947 family protein [Pseudonocardia sp.]|uniref:DUF5947 family protein n=1 Tax=Pseudonocardia sp. TaxID=60912 RepID=UPI002BAABB3D|nr:DUF5947 family protein [Pseudonocardia sp.]HTF54784.1 DUF5947 family protein [Pseudonocardia sp.]